MTVRLDPPLLDAMRHAGYTDADLRRLGVHIRPGRGHVTERTADRVCCAIGTHLALVYPHTYTRAEHEGAA